MDRVNNWPNRPEKESGTLSEDEQSGQSSSSPPKGSGDGTDMTDLGAPQSPANQRKEPSEEGEAKEQSSAEKLVANLKPLADNNEEEIYTVDQPWWDGQTGPLTREDFETYKGLVSEKLKKVRLEELKFLERYQTDIQNLRLDASDRERDLGGLRGFIEKEELFEKSDVRKDLEERVTEQKEECIKLEYQLNDALKQLEVFNKAQREARRGKIHLPDLTADHAGQGMEQPPFLYSNLTDQNIESKVHMLLLRAELAIESEDYQEADRYACEAFQQAQLLDFTPIEARCAYWRGRVAFAVERYDIAELAFKVACEHACEWYAEGTAASEWMQATQSKAGKGKRAMQGEEQGIPPDAPIELSESPTDLVPELPSKRAGKLPNPNRSSIGPGAKVPESLGDALGPLSGGSTPTTGNFLQGNWFSAFFDPAQSSGSGIPSSPDVPGGLGSRSDSGELSE